MSSGFVDISVSELSGTTATGSTSKVRFYLCRSRDAGYARYAPKGKERWTDDWLAAPHAVHLVTVIKDESMGSLFNRFAGHLWPRKIKRNYDEKGNLVLFSIWPLRPLPAYAYEHPYRRFKVFIENDVEDDEEDGEEKSSKRKRSESADCDEIARLKDLLAAENEKKIEDAEARASIATEKVGAISDEIPQLTGERPPNSTDELFRLQTRLNCALVKIEGAIEGARQSEKETANCVVCLEAPKNVVLLPCRHLCACEKDAEALRSCPLCRCKVDI